MSRFLKWTIGVIAVLAVLVGGAALAVRLFLSSEQMKNLALAQGREFLGRKLQIKELSIGLFKVKASGLVVEEKSGAPGGGGPPLLRVNEIDILINPMALLYKKLSVLGVTLTGVQVSASRDEKGRFSFQDIIDRIGKGKDARAVLPGRARGLASLIGVSEAEAAPEGSGEGPVSGFRVVVEDVELRNVQVNFESVAFGGMPAFRAKCSFERAQIDELIPADFLPIEAAGKCSEPGAVEFVAKGIFDLGKKYFRGNATFTPFDVMPFLRLAPPVSGVRPLSGMLGGKATVSFSNENNLTWDLDLNADGLGAEVQISESEKWRRKSLANLRLKSKGSFSLKEGSAEIETLSMGLPFARVNLKKLSIWNRAGRDEIHLDVKLQDAGVALKWADPFIPLPLGDVKGGGEAALSVSATRDRRKGEDFGAVSSIKFSSMAIGSYAAIIPRLENARRIRGKLSGEAEVSFSAAWRAGWKVNLRGQSVSADIRNNPKEKWRPLGLSRIEVRTEGTYDLKNDGAEVASLDVTLPFGSARLAKKARWNVSGRDEENFEMKISDITAAAASGLALRKDDIPKNKKIDLKLALSRDRNKKKGGFSVSGSGAIDPIDIAPFAGLVPASLGIRKMKGVIGGRTTFSLNAGKDAAWVANLSGTGVSGEWDLDGDGEWVPLRLASFKIDTAGNYNIPKESALIERLDARFPFASVSLLKKGEWNVSGKDAIDIKWDVPDLAAAVAAAKPLVGDLANLAEPDGSAMGSLQIRRNRKKSDAFSVTGSVDADIKEVHLPDRPKFEARGKARVVLDGKTLALNVPRFVLRERGSPEAADAAVLEDFRVSFSQKDLWQGHYVAPKATDLSMKINIFMDSKKDTNLASILKSKKTKPPKQGVKKSSSAPSPPPGKRAESNPLTSVPRLVASLSKPFTQVKPRNLPPERVAKDLPEVKIKLIEVASLDVLFVHQFGKKSPPIRLGWKNLKLRVDTLDTRMRPGKLDTRVRLTEPGRPAPLAIDMNANAGVSPPAMRGAVTLNRFDLRLVSPYAEQIRGMKIRQGTVDLSSKFNMRRNYLKSRAKATVFDLDLKTTRRTPFIDDAQILIQKVAIGLLKRDNKQIPVNVEIEGPVDDPSFSIIRAMTEGILGSVIEKIASLPGGTKQLGGDIKAIVKEVIGGAMGTGGGAEKTAPPAQESSPGKQVNPGKPVIPGGSSSSGGARSDKKELEKLGKDVLKGLFGR